MAEAATPATWRTVFVDRVPPVAALLLHSFALNTNSVMLSMRCMPPASGIFEVILHLSGIVLSALLFPLLLFEAGREDWRAVAGRLFLVAFPFLFPAARLVGFDAWLHDPVLPYVMIFINGILYPPVYILFFRQAPPGQVGLWFGTGMAVRALAIGFVSPTAEMRDVPELWLSRFHQLNTAHFIAVSVVALILVGNAVANRNLRNWLPPPDAADPEADRIRRGDAVRVLAALGLFALMCGFTDGETFPYFGARSMDVPWQQTAATAVFCPLLGWWLDRHPGGFRRVIRASSALFLVAPSLIVLSDTPDVLLVVRVLVVMADFGASIAAVLAVAKLARGCRWYGLALCSVYIIRGTAAFSYWFFSTIHQPPKGIVVLAGILTAMALWALVDRMVHDNRPIAAGAKRQEEKETSDAEKKIFNTVDIFLSHGLTPRECDVASLLIRGASTREIAENLGISGSTVVSHSRNILLKFNTPTRKSFMAVFITES